MICQGSFWAKCYNRAMKVKNADEMMAYGEKLGHELKLPAVIELLGDVGAGKTTLTRGIAAGLGVRDNVTSPSFNISKRYAFVRPDGTAGTLVHYDFYRLPDPGIMSEELAETLQDPNAVVVIEWGASVADLLPAEHRTIKIDFSDDGDASARQITDQHKPQ